MGFPEGRPWRAATSGIYTLGGYQDGKGMWRGTQGGEESEEKAGRGDGRRRGLAAGRGEGENRVGGVVEGQVVKGVPHGRGDERVRKARPG
ncbi:hypothetical protein Afil01_65640 [Actinorhabdospora filicis]|uniref:Uncharacterized protein n=1 Tax=Actinorhabdospora filicis TaxID=1785913 RepID=A0A9W6W6N9_9ACTN|nr:hypothetical protein Afil01_65640 [Actinorhabdospora filicis]